MGSCTSGITIILKGLHLCCWYSEYSLAVCWEANAVFPAWLCSRTFCIIASASGRTLFRRTELACSRTPRGKRARRRITVEAAMAAHQGSDVWVWRTSRAVCKIPTGPYPPRPMLARSPWAGRWSAAEETASAIHRAWLEVSSARTSGKGDAASSAAVMVAVVWGNTPIWVELTTSGTLPVTVASAPELKPLLQPAGMMVTSVSVRWHHVSPREAFADEQCANRQRAPA